MGESFAAVKSKPATCSKDFTPGVVRRLWFVFVQLALVLVEYGILFSSLQYIILTFFAAKYGGGDCALTPSSEPCRQATGDVAIYNGIIGGVGRFGSVFFAVVNGSISDSIGRRPIILIKSTLGVLVTYAIGMHQFLGVSLWVYLILDPILSSFDMTAVIVAMTNDVITDKKERAGAISIQMSFAAFLMCLILPCSLAPTSILVAVAVVAATVKLGFSFLCIPETAPNASADASARFTPVRAWVAAFRLIRRNSFISRMAVIATLGSISTSASAVVMTPYMTGYLGFTRTMFTGLGIETLVVVLFVLGFVAAAATKHLGEVRVYQVCLFFVALGPAVVCFVTEAWQFFVLAPFLIGPAMLQGPVVMAIKSNIVNDDEQGLVQGALVAIVNLSGAIAQPVFGWLYYYCTAGGTDVSPYAALPTFLLGCAIGFLAFVVACTLPTKLPEPASTRLVTPIESGMSQPLIS